MQETNSKTEESPASLLFQTGGVLQYFYLARDQYQVFLETLKSNMEIGSEDTGDFSLEDKLHFNIKHEDRSGAITILFEPKTVVAIVFWPFVDIEHFWKKTFITAKALGDALAASLSGFSQSRLTLSAINKPLSQIVKNLHDNITTIGSASIAGSLWRLFYPLPHREHVYLLDAENKEAIDEFIHKAFPSFDQASHKLRQEIQLFEDRRKAVDEECDRIDNEVNQILHTNFVLKQTDIDIRSSLEKEIEKVSRLFSILATNNHLIQESATTLERELWELKECASTLFPGINPSATGEILSHSESVYKRYLELLQQSGKEIDTAQRNARAVLEVIGSRIELLRGNETIALQEQSRELLNRNLLLEKERTTLQVAASVLEFVIIFYYALKSWESIVTHQVLDHLPALSKLGVTTVFSMAAVFFTHYIAKGIQKHKVNWMPMLASGIALIGSLALMVILSMKS